ncbi:MAG TPA: IPT/TIG domain-containing protein [Candidatus Paceibacterota bacterium]|nr:IPT/TIG domain-containing protein [Candidatus Paceibacterota bacterium]
MNKVMLVPMALGVVGLGLIMFLPKHPDSRSTIEIPGDVLIPATNKNPEPVADEGVEPPMPVITSISPKSGPVGTQIEIRGKGFTGFESDVEFVVVHPDGKSTAVYVGTPGNTIEGTIPNPTETYASFKIEDQCPDGTTIGRYSGIESPCEHDVFPPGVYKVYTQPWGVKSNVVTFTVTK